MDNISYKICSKCKISKLIKEFSLCSKEKNGHKSRCKECTHENYIEKKDIISIQQKKYYEANKDSKKQASKQYALKNKPYIKKWKKEYYKENREKIAEKRKEDRTNNREEISIKRKIYRKNNKERINAAKSKYHQENKERISLKRKYYRENNKIKLAETKREYYENNKNEIQFKLANNLRGRFRAAIKNNAKVTSIIELTGCTILELKKYIEYKFTKGMTWGNWSLSGWHLDHKIPCSSFDLTDSRQQKKCFHFANLQPLWAKDNLKKGNKII